MLASHWTGAFLLALLSVTFLPSSLVAKDKVTPIYEHGRVVATDDVLGSGTTPVYTDNQGKTQGGLSFGTRTPTYKIETAERFYRITNRKRQLSLGQDVEFRIQKRNAYIRDKDQERKYDIIGVELKIAPK
jgi:hypothetical protein